MLARILVLLYFVKLYHDPKQEGRCEDCKDWTSLISGAQEAHTVSLGRSCLHLMAAHFGDRGSLDQ